MQTSHLHKHKPSTRRAIAGRPLIFFVVVLLWIQVTPVSAVKARQSVWSKDTTALLIRRIYPFIAAVNAHRPAGRSLASYKPLRKIARAKTKLLRKDLKAGRLEKAIRDAQFTSGQVKTIIESLIHLNHTDPAITALITQLRAAGAYTANNMEGDSAFVRQMVENVTQGMEYAANVYLFGRKPAYGKIDAISIDIKNPKIRTALTDSLRRWRRSGRSALFYYLPLKTALTALKMNGRTEAIRYEPLTSGMNAQPVAAVKKTNFRKYTYSAILVPGLGPEKPEVPLTKGGKARCRMAAREFAKGQAPFLIVSGGHVHPNKTPFCEAVEMKKYMVDSLGVDNSRILIEPYARHTTTNLRNATRLLQLTGMPLDKSVLIVTDKSQSAYINKGMRKTSLKDLGYTPYKELKILSQTHTAFIPSVNCLRVNPLDPLDP